MAAVNYIDAAQNLVTNPDLSINTTVAKAAISGTPTSLVGGSAQSLTGASSIIVVNGNVMSLPLLGANKPLP